MIGWTDRTADLSDHAALARLRARLPEAPVVSSDLSRARATADALARGPRLPDDPRLREIHFGQWEDRSFAEVDAEDPERLRAFWERPGLSAPPGGEGWDALRARVDAALDDLLAPAMPDLVIVAHFGPILCALQRARGVSTETIFAQKIEPLSLTRIDRHGDGWAVDRVNQPP